ncbi:MAG: septum formation family protein [Acidimicrobiia bacterium]|nr:septum formation family protein [Acidimicrobiia bacterium]
MTGDSTPGEPTSGDRTPDEELVPNVSSEELIRLAKEDVFDDDPLEGYQPAPRAFDDDQDFVTTSADVGESVDRGDVDRSAEWPDPVMHAGTPEVTRPEATIPDDRATELVSPPPPSDPFQRTTGMPPVPEDPTGPLPPSPPDSRSGGSRWGGLLRVAVVAALFLFGGGFVRSLIDPGTDVQDLAIGDCFQEFEGTEISRVETVDCAEPHVYEVIANIELPDGPYPGEGQISEVGFERCLPEFQPYVGSEYETSVWYVTPLVPLDESWPDDRIVTCLVLQAHPTNPNEPGTVTGSARGAGN